MADDRCPYLHQRFQSLSQMREDGWRCAREKHHEGRHTLLSADGERILDQDGPWIMPEPTAKESPMSEPENLLYREPDAYRVSKTAGVFLRGESQFKMLAAAHQANLAGQQSEYPEAVPLWFTETPPRNEVPEPEGFGVLVEVVLDIDLGEGNHQPQVEWLTSLGDGSWVSHLNHSNRIATWEDLLKWSLTSLRVIHPGVQIPQPEKES